MKNPVYRNQQLYLKCRAVEHIHITKDSTRVPKHVAGLKTVQTVMFVTCVFTWLCKRIL